MAVTVRDDIDPAHCRGSAEFLTLPTSPASSSRPPQTHREAEHEWSRKAVRIWLTSSAGSDSP
jgi:hypothetical protein